MLKSMKVGPQGPSQDPRKWARPSPRRPALAGTGRLRKIALLGGANTLKFAPWTDPTWELWSHHSCRHLCQREPDLFFDLHPEALWRSPDKKFWDKNYLTWLQQNHVPIYMQNEHKDIPSSMRYPFETMITEFPRGYMTNTPSYMIALALMEGVTHIGVYGCHYDSATEYGPQRGSMEYWLGVAEGRGVQVLIPPTCDLLNRPSLLYGYQSHPNGERDKSYLFIMGPKKLLTPEEQKQQIKDKVPPDPVPHSLGGMEIPLADIGQPPALKRALVYDEAGLQALHDQGVS